ncbi:hypothetical protein [Bacillus sp. FJAT-45350]|uniref:hypothetical protein n=1 Tax=Bacillus sp. FJAT-45350 TaxID=2011014 RepID=UPI000BB6F631|nr:hypothetical protein [Bacillus sp. FJAT-45350]
MILKPIDVTNGSTIKYSDVFGNLGKDFTINKGNEVAFFVYDQYCMNPSCDCDEVILEFVENKNNERSEFAIRLSFDKKMYLIIDSYKISNTEVDQIVKGLLKDSNEVMNFFKNRYQDMKKKGMEVLEGISK